MRRIGIALSLLGLSAPALSQTTFDFPTYERSVIHMSAKGARAEKEGSDLVLTIPSINLVMNAGMAKGPDVRYEDLAFDLYRRGPDGKPQHIGRSTRSRDFKGTLDGSRKTASLQNVTLRYPQGAKECTDGCIVSLTAFVRSGDWQTGSLSAQAEIKVK